MESLITIFSQFSNSSPVIGSILEIILKSTAIFSMMIIFYYVMKKFKVGNGYAVLFGGIVLILLTPFISFFLPEVNVYPSPKYQAVEVSSIKRGIEYEQTQQNIEISEIEQKEVNSAQIKDKEIFSIHLLLKKAIVFSVLVVILLFVKILIGIAGSIFIKYKSYEINESIANTLLSECKKTLGISKKVMFLINSKVSMPFTTGHINPAIILPENYTDWSYNKLRAVLLHELAHIKRNDFLASIFVSIATSIYWFNPVATLIKRKIEIERELASDKIVVSNGINSHDYAKYLLEIARQNSCKKRFFAIGLTMAAKNNLEKRILDLITKDDKNQKLKKRIGIGLIGFFLLLSVTIATISAKKGHDLNNYNFYEIDFSSAPENAQKLRNVASSFTIHKVKFAETLSEIALKYDVNYSEIMTWNNLQNDLIRENEKLIIYFENDFIDNNENENIVKVPVLKESDLTADELLYEIGKHFNIKIKKQQRMWQESDFKYLAIDSVYTFYKVKKGDDIFSIAAKFDMPVQKLKNLNRLRSNKVKIGQLLKVTKVFNTPKLMDNFDELITITSKDSLNSDADIFGGVLKDDSIKTNTEFEGVTVSNSAKNLNSGIINITAKRGETIGSIAEKYKVNPQTLRNWNNLKSSKISIGQKLQITNPKFSSKIAAGFSSQKFIHKVKRNETLASIAEKYNVSTQELKSWNRLKTNKIVLGQRLSIQSNNIKISEKPDSIKSYNSDETVVSISKSSAINVGNRLTHVVKKGETISDIAEKYNVTIQELREKNKLKMSRLIAGQKLQIPNSNLKTTSSKVENKYFTYTVNRGDSLKDIAEKYKTDISTILKLNNMKSEKIAVHQKLKIPSN